MTVGLGLWAWQLWSGWRQSLVLPLLASVALVAVTRWVRVGLLIILGGMVVKVLATPLVLAPNYIGNHTVLEYLCLALLLFVGSRDDDDGEVELCLQALRWLLVLVLLYSGVQKLWYGTYFRGEYLAFRIAATESYQQVFGWLIGHDEVERLIEITRQAKLRFVRDQPAAALPGPYRVDSWSFVVVSNLVWILEILTPALLLIKRTRALGVLVAIGLIIAIEVAAQELIFGALILNLLALFLIRDRRRVLVPAVGLIYALAIAGRFGLVQLTGEF